MQVLTAEAVLADQEWKVFTKKHSRLVNVASWESVYLQKRRVSKEPTFSFAVSLMFQATEISQVSNLYTISKSIMISATKSVKDPTAL